MSGTHRFKENVAWNLMGYVLPLVVAVGVIPILVHRMGPDRFGLLSFVWMIVGYSALLDLGIGRAMTQGIAERLGRGADQELRGLILTGAILLITLGLLGSLAILSSSGWIAARVLKVPHEMSADALKSLRMLTVALPLVVVSSGLRGVIEGCQRFREISLVRSFIGILLYLSPLLVLTVTGNVWAIVGALVIVRALEVGVYAFMCIRLVARLPSGVALWEGHLRQLFSFGLWSTANNLVGSLMAMAYVDRIFITTLLGTAALAYYATPFDVIARTLIVPTALMGVLFPVFSGYGTEKADQADRMASQALRLVLYGILPPFLVLIVFSRPLLSLWLGGAFPSHSTLSLQLFALGTVAISMAYMPFALIQALGRPDLTAKRHFIELPIYLLASIFAIREFGISGGSAVWCAWAWLDLVFILQIRRRLLPGAPAILPQGQWIWLVVFLVVAFLIGISAWPVAQMVSGLLLPLGFLVWGWTRWLDNGCRVLLLRRMPASIRARFTPAEELL